MPVVDLLLATRGCLRHRSSLAERWRPLHRATEVGPGIYLAAVAPEVAHVVFHVCKFRDLDERDATVLYGFVRYNPPGEDWDSDRAIRQLLFLSHFVHPHCLGFEFAARIEHDDRRRVTRVVPFDAEPSFIRAYPSRGVERLWLTQDEGAALADLNTAYSSSREYLKDKRLGLAISLFSGVPFLQQARPRAAVLAAALEGLISTSSERAYKQFMVRVPALAGHVGMPECDKRWAEAAYKFRSKLAHGAPLLQVEEEAERRRRTDEMDGMILRMDELLRRLLRRGLQDREFATMLDEVDVHWPVGGKGCPSCRTSDSSLLPVTCPRCQSPW